MKRVSNLPTDSASDKAVDSFGLGMYDESVSKQGKGEDSNSPSQTGKSLPDGGGSLDPYGPDRLMSYPDNLMASARLPGDSDRLPRNYRNDTIMNVVPSVALSQLPTGTDGPSARSDYYDRMTTGLISDIWPSEDKGVYAQEKESDPDSDYKVSDNDVTTKNNLQSLGNYWSGYNIEAQDVPYGFPSEDYSLDNSPSLTGGKMASTQRIASNPEKVRGLTAGLFKELGKKDLTKRHVLAYLKKLGEPQYLSSELILCAHDDHGVYIKDVLDEFPFKKSASQSIEKTLLELEIRYLRHPHIAEVFRTAAFSVIDAQTTLDVKVKP